MANAPRPNRVSRSKSSIWSPTSTSSNRAAPTTDVLRWGDSRPSSRPNSSACRGNRSKYSWAANRLTGLLAEVVFLVDQVAGNLAPGRQFRELVDVLLDPPGMLGTLAAVLHVDLDQLDQGH